jgi:hypothetical protein
LRHNSLGVSVRGRIWSFNETILNLDSAIGATSMSSLPILLDSNNMSSWITLPFDTTNAVLAAGQYLVGIEVTASPTHKGLALASDCDMEEIKARNSNYVLDQYFRPSIRWRETEKQLAIRLNVKNNINSPCLVGLGPTVKKAYWNLFPNPNQGNFQLSLSDPLAFERVEVRNLKGQLISRKWLSGDKLQTLSYTDLDAGIYFISLIGEEARETQKLIIR